MPIGSVNPPKPRPPGARKRGIVDKEREPYEGPVSHGYFKASDGTKLFYSIEGRGKPLIFCYGLVCSSLHWTYQIEHFRKNYQTIWFDYRGHHNSDIPADLNTLSVQTMASDLGVLFEELDLREAVILGHSMGVNVALDFYRQFPDRVSGLVLANGTAKRPLETLFNINAFQAAFQLLRKAYLKSPNVVSKLWKLQKNNPLSKTLISLGGFNPYLTAPEDIELYANQVAEMDPAILIHLIDNYDKYDSTAWLHRIEKPTLILAGENDKITPLKEQELIHQLIPNSELIKIRHGSHCPQMDLPELFTHHIEKFLGQMGYR